MISVTEAKNILQNSVQPSPIHSLPLDQAIGYVLAENIHSPIEVPLFDNSAMDGYALALSEGVDQWTVKYIIQAGESRLPDLHKGEAARIFTGAPVPAGADTVVQQEVIERTGDRISFDQSKFEIGSNIRRSGSQNKKGDLLVTAGSLITPGTIGLLASVGIAEVNVYKDPSVAIIITGNEIKDVGSVLELGQIYNSNGPVLKAYLSLLGIKNIEIYKAADERQALQEVIDLSLSKHDVVLLSGGISVGDYDFVKEGLAKAGVQELFYKIKQRPGKPLFAGIKDRKLIFALPGNPASVMTCFNQYVKPSIRQMMGHLKPWLPTAQLPIAHDFPKKEGLTFFMKAITEDGKVKTLTGQESFNQLSFGVSNCFVELSENNDIIAAGTVVNVYEW
jgi:molybdopterin molybdotransferase